MPLSTVIPELDNASGGKARGNYTLMDRFFPVAVFFACTDGLGLSPVVLEASVCMRAHAKRVRKQ